MEATYVSTNSFTVVGDRTSEFVTGRRVKFNCGPDGTRYATIVSSSYSSPDTTVIIDETTLTSNLSEVLYGIISPGTIGSIPVHSHDGSEGSGGTVSGTGGSSTFIGLSDTPPAYDSGKFLISTSSGISFADQTSSSVTSDFSTYELVTELTFSSNTPNETISWDGEVDDVIYIECVNINISGNSTGIRFRLNNDSGTNYNYGVMYQDGSVSSSSQSSSQTSFPLVSAGIENTSSRIVLHLKNTGNYRHMFRQDSRYYASNTDQNYLALSGSWNNNSDDVTSIQIFSDQNVTSGIIRVYRFGSVSLPLITVISGSGGGTSNVQNFLDLTDTPSSYDNGKYLRSTASGIEFSDVILTSSGSLQWRLNVSDDGTLYTTVV